MVNLKTRGVIAQAAFDDSTSTCQGLKEKKSEGELNAV
jgi:hypothetical protein